MAMEEEARGEATAAVVLVERVVVELMESDEMDWKDGVNGGDGASNRNGGGDGEKC